MSRRDKPYLVGLYMKQNPHPDSIHNELAGSFEEIGAEERVLIWSAFGAKGR